MVKKNVRKKLNHVDCGTLKLSRLSKPVKDARGFFSVSNFKQQLFEGAIEVQILN